MSRSASASGAAFWRAASFAPLNLLSGLGHALGCSLLPADCSICGSPLSQLTGSPICEGCWEEIPGQREFCCARCGEDLFQPVAVGEAGQAYCRACRLAPPGFVRAASAGEYDGSLRAAIHVLKFDRVAPVAKRLGRLLAGAMESFAAEVPGGMLVLPVPLHGRRKAQRGFNQAEKLAAEALRVLRQSHPDWRLELSSRVLVRQRSTDSQAGLSPRQRRQNLRGAFFVSAPEQVAGREILLVDDIYTTGATARACSAALLKAGAASVRVATLARAQRRVPRSIVERQRYLQGSSTIGPEAHGDFGATIH